MADNKCKICLNQANHTRFMVPEMMFGTGEKFEYFECGECGCLQISDTPIDMSRYYPKNYYSFSPKSTSVVSLAQMAKRQRFKYSIEKRGSIGRLLHAIFGDPSMSKWFTVPGVTWDDNILDVGCGSGQLLHSLSDLGFSRLTGIDPYAPSDVVYDNGVKVYKKDLSELDGKYDFVMLHHSLEHMENQYEAIQEVYRVLHPNRFALIRIPVTSSYAWRMYGIHWVQLDAPRHLFLHTERSMRKLAEKAGFHVAHVIYDSSAMQFWGSEQYKMGISLKDRRSPMNNRKSPMFTSKELERFQTKAVLMNSLECGDQACFFIHKK